MAGVESGGKGGVKGDSQLSSLSNWGGGAANWDIFRIKEEEHVWRVEDDFAPFERNFSYTELTV